MAPGSRQAVAALEDYCQIVFDDCQNTDIDGLDVAPSPTGHSGLDIGQTLTKTPDGIELIEGPQPGRRRRFTAEEKRRLVTEAVAPGSAATGRGLRKVVGYQTISTINTVSAKVAA
jgi:hypothetical protein